MHSRRLRKIETGIDKYDPDLLVMKEFDDCRAYKNLLYKNPDKRFFLKVSRSMMYYFHCCNEDISDKQHVIDATRRSMERRLAKHGLYPLENKPQASRNQEKINDAASRKDK
jgi:protease II